MNRNHLIILCSNDFILFGVAYKMTVISTLKEGTTCHGYVIDCKSHVLFDKGMQDCSGTCLVSQRDDIPNGVPYCPHMIVGGEGNRPPIKIKGDSCFKVDGEPSKWTYKKIRCPDK